jgi:excisionase family DNA binding protein
MDTISPNITGKKIEAEWVSVRDAAVMLGIHRSTVYGLMAQKRLEAKKLGVKTIVSVASIRRLPETLPDVKRACPNPGARSRMPHRAGVGGHVSFLRRQR